MITMAPSDLDTRWDFFAACRDAPHDLFVTQTDGDVEPDDEPDYPTAEQLQFCNGCPVRKECLDVALANPELVGTWGGTSSYQRRQLRRPRLRRTCPGCGTMRIRIERGYGFCPACAISWPV